MKLNSKMKTVWLIRNLIGIIIFLVASIVSFVTLKDNAIALAIALCALSIIIALIFVIYPFLAYNRYTYNYDERRIDIKRGVIFKHHIICPVRQIQDLHTYEGPLMMLFKLSGVIISTAGSNYTIDGLSKEQAAKMIEDLEIYLNNRLDEE